jgi:hypothetical protein
MFDSQKSDGAGHTAMAAFLAFALVFIPAICIFLRPGYFGLSLAFAGSAICLVVAWVSTKRSSRLGAIGTDGTKAK